MAGELTTTTGALSANIEQVLLGGDLSKLNPQERLSYYNAVCQSLALNPLTQPFAYIVLNNKLTLYAKKDCTEQLRKVHGVSITKVDPKQIGDLLVVVSEAVDRAGRTDSATGAVAVKNVEGKDRNNNKYVYDLTGENLANAMMKAETKAKRRVTLSLCGLGMLDETEVDTLKQQGVASDEPQGNNWGQNRSADPTPAASAATTTQAIPPVQTAEQVSPFSGGEPDIRPRSQRTAQPSAPAPANAPEPTREAQQAPQGEIVSGEPTISEKQRKRMFAIQKSVGLSDQDVKDEMVAMGLTCHRDNVPTRRYNELIDRIDSGMKFHTNDSR